MTNERFFTGGQASRAEVYGLFLAAVVLIGGGVGGAIAFTNTDEPVVVSTATASASATAVAPEVSSSPGVVTSASPAPVASSDAVVSSGASASPTASASTAVSTCPYTEAELAYWNSIRAGKQQVVDQAMERVANVRSWIVSNTAHLEELLAAPYRPIEVFQWKPDGSPYVWRVDSNEEIAFERQRIADNEAELVRAQAALAAAVADRNLVPGC